MMFCLKTGGQVHAVTSTTASVGPYKLCNVHLGNRSRKRRTVAAGRASPLHITRTKAEHSPSQACSRTACNIEGTKCIVVMLFLRIVLIRYEGSLCPSGRAITSLAPTSRGQKNSQTETSKLNGVFCSTTSLKRSSYSHCIQMRRLTMPRCSTATPFGMPVEPEV